ncbi:nucleopolyhedrovirus P10 family protein [Streptomyces sp. NPDC090106]|uniref:nucleopolyhedrovirus P10 family protein n=1 Tax=Streptomyces sp. NPDC090106 TaxID=3365946 RepID=UPI00382CFD1D
MTDRWTKAVRRQLGLGRLLPLGGARDGAWIAEEAADSVLRRAVRELRGVRLEGLRIALADPLDVREPVVPAPPSALPPGPLRLEADVAATGADPLPATAAHLRAALARAAREGLGLEVAEIDLRVTGLLEDVPDDGAVRVPEPAPAGAGDDPAALAALSVPGVAGVTRLLGSQVGAGAALPREHVRIEVVVDADHRAVEVARAVRARVRQAVPGRPTVAVLVTAVV